ncbi:MAG: DUF5011 domain-containing protein [Clostridia bacterium]|nr:DUF5011 domain-containing protein [Clostridia bacterium]
MKKSIIALMLALILTLSCFAPAALADNGPAITGEADQTVEAGTEFDALAGLTASDPEDGDLTDMITVEAMPELSFRNGKATPETAGEYELIYSVTDKDGNVAEAYATLTVTKKKSEETVYKAFDFSTVAVTDNHGWEARIGEAASAAASLKSGAYVIEIANPGNGDGDVQLAKAGYALKAADYKIKIWAKSTKPTYAHFIARDENAEGWETFGAVWNARIEENIAPIELNFTSAGEGSAELLFNLGKITPNPDNAADTTPEDFTVTIDKIELYEISGEEHQVPVYTADLTTGGVTVDAGDGANAAVTFDGTAKVTIDNYPAEGGVWSIKANIGLGGLTIEKGQKYYYSFTVNAANGQSGECLVESDARSWECRANFNGLSAAAGEDVVVSAVFTAEADVDDPVIRLQIGNAPEGVTNNTITISNVEFGKLEGDKETIKTIEAFMPFGPNTANAENPAYPWQTFNGTDEDNERGVGTIWTEDGSFFYRIDNGGTVDWHNKLICGFGSNPLTLAADSYYIVEITAKADKDVSCGVFLNPMGGWDPRFAEGMSLTQEFQTFRFATTDTFIMDMNFELLFQFGSEATANLGEVTVEFQNITIYQMSVL